MSSFPEIAGKYPFKGKLPVAPLCIYTRSGVYIGRQRWWGKEDAHRGDAGGVGVMVTSGVAAAGTMLEATLTGAAEVPGPGRPRSTSCPAGEDLLHAHCIQHKAGDRGAHTQRHRHRGRPDSKGTEGAERRLLRGVRQAQPDEDHDDPKQPVRVLRQRPQQTLPERRRERPALSRWHVTPFSYQAVAPPSTTIVWPVM